MTVFFFALIYISSHKIDKLNIKKKLSKKGGVNVRALRRSSTDNIIRKMPASEARGRNSGA